VLIQDLHVTVTVYKKKGTYITFKGDETLGRYNNVSEEKGENSKT